MIDKDIALRFFAETTADCHLTKDVLRKFATESLGCAKKSALVNHHLLHCDQCREVLAKEAFVSAEDSAFPPISEALEGQQRFLNKLPALNTLLQRNRHVEALAKILTPLEKHWLLPSVLVTLHDTYDHESEDHMPGELRQAAAFGEMEGAIGAPWVRSLIGLMRFVQDMENAVSERWASVLLKEGPLTIMLDECIAASPESNEWSSDIKVSVREYYLQDLLSGEHG